jgi:hypothetical protein
MILYYLMWKDNIMSQKMSNSNMPNTKNNLNFDYTIYYSN